MGVSVRGLGTGAAAGLGIGNVCLIILGSDCTDLGASGVASRIIDLPTMAISNKDPITTHLKWDF